MAGLMSSFALGSNVHIRIGGIKVAHITNLSFSEDVSTGAVGGIGSYSYDAIEPLQYAARGSFSITRYTKEALKAIYDDGNPAKKFAPGRVNGKAELFKGFQSLVVDESSGADGNSILTKVSFSPAHLMLSQAFDIVVTERSMPGVGEEEIFTCIDCRLVSYSVGFTPGSLVSENVGFICIRIEDASALTEAGLEINGEVQ